jgi:hypothetical protein
MKTGSGCPSVCKRSLLSAQDDEDMSDSNYCILH